MGEIDQSLVTFKATVAPSLSSMSAAGSKISDSIRRLTVSTSYFENDFEHNYESENKKKIISIIDEVNDIYSRISSGVESNLQGFISGSNEVIELVTELENINNEIAEQQKIVDANMGDTEAEQEAKKDAEGIIYNKNLKFEEVHKEALDSLNRLKGQDASIVIPQALGKLDENDEVQMEYQENKPIDTPEEKEPVTKIADKEVEEAKEVEEVKEEKDKKEKKETKSTEISKDLLQYGTYETRKFVTSKGETVEYNIYIPKNYKNVDSLPAMLYLHGYSEGGYNDPSWHRNGLTGMIENKNITPPGIVIMPHISDHNNLEAIKELTDYVVKQYSCDTDRISISGHSYGARETYKMVNKYKDYFSCAVPISGTNSESITSGAFDGMNVWAFGGSYEGGTAEGQQAIAKINKLGGNGKFTVLKGGHGEANMNTYKGEYESPTGETINPIMWAMKQVKS